MTVLNPPIIEHHGRRFVDNGNGTWTDEKIWLEQQAVKVQKEAQKKEDEKTMKYVRELHPMELVNLKKTDPALYNQCLRAMLNT
jgi:hypothetical protein